MSAPELLDVPAVLARYNLRDRRAARKVIDAAGGFVVAGRLLVRLEDLLAHEDELRQARRRSSGASAPPAPAKRSRTRRRTSPDQREPLPRGWWRDGNEAGGTA